MGIKNQKFNTKLGSFVSSLLNDTIVPFKASSNFRIVIKGYIWSHAIDSKSFSFEM